MGKLGDLLNQETKAKLLSITKTEVPSKPVKTAKKTVLKTDVSKPVSTTKPQETIKEEQKKPILAKVSISGKVKTILRKKPQEETAKIPVSPVPETAKVSNQVLIKKTPTKAKETTKTDISKPFSSLFPDFEESDLYYGLGSLTKRGAVYQYHFLCKEKVCKPIIKDIRDLLKDKTLLTKAIEQRIYIAFDSICLSAMGKASEVKGKETKEQLIEYISKNMGLVKDIQLSNLSFFDI